MGAFELSNRESDGNPKDLGNDRLPFGEAASSQDTRRIKDECIIALKVYDSCRQPRCKLLLPQAAIYMQ